MLCAHCSNELYGESEHRRKVCYECYSYGLDHGRWPDESVPSVQTAEISSQGDQSDEPADPKNQDPL